jgi:hypothetical protein
LDYILDKIAMLPWRLFLFSVMQGAPLSAAVANVIEWFKTDSERFYDIRQAFLEYDDLGDLAFAQRMLHRTENIAAASEHDQDTFFTLFMYRLPQYREYNRTLLRDELIRLFSKAVDHFSMSR